MINIKKFLNGLRIIPRTSTAADTKGELEVIDSTGKLGYHNGSSVSPVVTEAHTATLTNKTLTSPTITGATITTPTITVADSGLTIQDNGDNTKQLKFEASGITAGQTRTLTAPDASTTIVGTDTSQTLTNKTLTTPIIAQISNTGTLTLPTSTDTLVGRDTTDTLTNKTLTSPTINTPTITSPTITVRDNALTVQDQGDNTKQFQFEASGISAGQTRVLTVPDANLTIVGEDTTQTLTNKTLTSPTIDDPTITGNIDASASEDIDLGTSNNATTIDIGTGSGGNTLNIGSGSGANTINLGGASSTVNIYGTVNNQNVTNLNVTDKLITINDGGAAASGGGSGIEVEEDSSITGYVKTSGDRNSWEFKAPNSAGVATLTPGSGADDIVLEDATQTLTNKTLTSPTINSPSGITKSDVGLGNVDNTSDATKDAAATALTNKTSIQVDNLTLDGNTISSTNSNGNIELEPNGTGLVRSTKKSAWTSAMKVGENTAPVASALLEMVSTSQGFLPPRMNLTQRDNISSPATGLLIYNTTTNKNNFYNGTSWTEVGSGNASGINYIPTIDRDAEAASVGTYITYADAAATSPVDGTGGSPGISFATDNTAPTRGTRSYQLQKDAANRQGNGVSIPFTIEDADVSRQLAIQFDSATSINYTGPSGTEYVSLWVYDITNSVLIPTSYSAGLPAGRNSIKATFNSTTSLSYRLIWHVSGTGTSLYNYQFDNVSVGPQEVIVGAAISDWTAWTPTGSWTSNVTYTGYWRRVGDTGQYRVKVICSGAPTSASLTINLPSGHVIDSTKIPSTNAAERDTIGVVYVSDAGIAGYRGFVAGDTSTSVQINYIATADASSTGSTTQVTQASPMTFGSGDFVEAEWTAPIANWSSGIQLANSRVEYASNSGMGDADDTSSFVNDPNGSPIPATTYTTSRTKRVRFKNPIQASDTIQVQVKPNNSLNSWIDIGTAYRDAGSSETIVNNINSSNGISPFAIVNSTDVDIIIGRYRADTSNWSASNTSRWRVVKYSNAVPVEIGTGYADYRYQTMAGNGATNTKIPYFTNANKTTDTGNFLTVSNSSTNGISFTANKRCKVSVHYHGNGNGSSQYLGLSVNSNQLTTAINSITETHRVGLAIQATSGWPMTVSWTGVLETGDVLRPHTDGFTTGSASGNGIFVFAEDVP